MTKVKKNLTFIDLFSGIGGFRAGMELAGHTCLGHCEIDKFAYASYISMHKPQKGEWYAKDIKDVQANEIPKADCWCFGFPCKDISIAGQKRGLRGNHSNLFYTVTRLIADIKEQDKPPYLFIENVKNLLSINRGFDFAKILFELDEIGYDTEWCVLNSRAVVPQNRDRIYIIGHLRGRGTRKVFPFGRANEQIETGRIKQTGRKANGKWKNPQANRIYDTSGISPCLSSMEGGQRQPCILVPTFIDLNVNGKLTNVARCLQARYNKGVTNNKGECSGVLVWQGKEYRVRRLTPLECFRLQGFSDSLFYSAQAVNSDSQLYKQAGNAVTVPVIFQMAKRMEILTET